MIRCYFHVQNGRRFEDVDGLDFSDRAAARSEAVGFARDLVRLNPKRRDWSKWRVHVTNDDGEPLLVLRFSEVL